jgi:hypothetical protein
VREAAGSVDELRSAVDRDGRPGGPGREWWTRVMDYPERESMIFRICHSLSLDSKFLASEVDYATGRFPASRIRNYASRDRDGRGLTPRVDKQKMFDDVFLPFHAPKIAVGKKDWNDVAERLTSAPSRQYDIVMVDEAHDFSANRIRAMIARLAPEGSLTVR